MLSIDPCPPTRERGKGGKGRETFKLDIKPALLIMQNIQTQYGVSGSGQWCPTSSCQAAPGSPGLDSAVDGNCTHRSLDQGPLQKASMNEESETLVMPQL